MRYLATFICLCVAGLLPACSTARNAQQAATSSPQSSAQPSPQSTALDPARISVYVTPFYDSKGPVIKIGRFGPGLASKDPKKFLSTIRKMQSQWLQLTFMELYVAAIRLYDLGYRNDAVYWFYTAQYRGRQFTAFLNPAKVGSVGSPAFELRAANAAFMETAGTWFNGYAFRDPNAMVGIVRRVQREGRAAIPNVAKIYPSVDFIDPRLWPAANAKLASGMDLLIAYLTQHQDEIKKQRMANGAEATFSRLSNKELPKD